MGRYLEMINSPADMKLLTLEQLTTLAQEIRDELVSSLSKTGGHLGPNLGVVELTIALHYIYDTPEDKLVWDVGHQTYTHKILTGRREAMSRLRMAGGIAGFPKREESPYDTFGTGHSSTSISAALGMAVAAHLQGSERRAVAIIGDGAMTAGMAVITPLHLTEVENPMSTPAASTPRQVRAPSAATMPHSMKEIIMPSSRPERE